MHIDFVIRPTLFHVGDKGVSKVWIDELKVALESGIEINFYATRVHVGSINIDSG